MRNENTRDQELDQILAALKAAQPNDIQMQKWKRAVQAESRLYINTPVSSRTKWALQLVAAMFVGIIIGAMAFKNQQGDKVMGPELAQISLDTATYERSHDNLD